MNKIIDQNGRLFGKVSVIDLLVVLVVLVMAFALHIKNNELDASKTSSDANVTITFTAKVENLSKHIADSIQVGDTVYDKDRSSGGAIGTITDIQVLPAQVTESMRDGTFVTVTNENACNLLVTIQGSGLVSNGRYSINRVYEIGINAGRNFCTPYAIFTGCVTEIH